MVKVISLEEPVTLTGIYRHSHPRPLLPLVKVSLDEKLVTPVVVIPYPTSPLAGMIAVEPLPEIVPVTFDAARQATRNTYSPTGKFVV